MWAIEVQDFCALLINLLSEESRSDATGILCTVKKKRKHFILTYLNSELYRSDMENVDVRPFGAVLQVVE